MVASLGCPAWFPAVRRELIAVHSMLRWTWAFPVEVGARRAGRLKTE